MTTGRISTVMAHQLKAAHKADHPNLMVHMDETDVKLWHFLVTNLPGPYAGGEYIFRLVAPDMFPQKPPEFHFLTPNGVFEPGGKICISIGEFHAGDAAGKTGAYGWRSALGMIGFAREVVNGMIDPAYLGGGIRVHDTPPATKARLAAASGAHNRSRHAELVGHFHDFEKMHPEHRVVAFRRMWRAADSAAATDFKSEELESLPPVLADAFGPEGWALLSESLGYACAIPEASAAQLVSMGFRVSGRDVTTLVAARIREALGEREPAIRHVLILVLHARILWELAAGDAPGKESWIRRFQEAFAAFAAGLPGVCGGACAKTVPAAMAAVGLAPAALPALHADLSCFLRAQDIDKKARLGKVFAARALAEAATAPGLKTLLPAPAEANSPEDAPAESAESAESAAATLGPSAPTQADLDMDSYLDELLGE
jgi:ubiquitin-protein ligase